ncbi:MAG: tyrosine recombinase XerC, partial [Simkaniaceae bacterium]|nr:tyrosine recombinase XerC [Simkaniaceae bacterium]
TILRQLSAMRSFFKHLTRRKIIPADPMQLIQSPKKPQSIPKALEYAQVVRLIESPDITEYLGVRDRVILELFYSSGLRVAELVDLNREDFDPHGCWLRVRGKGKKERLIPMTQGAAKWIERYLDHPERHLSTDLHQKQADPQAIFLNKFGKRITTRSVARRLKEYLIKANLVGNITPHTIRHTIATHWLEKGMDLKTIQTLLGHKSVSATTIYTKVSPQLKKRVYDESHPRAK